MDKLVIVARGRGSLSHAPVILRGKRSDIRREYHGMMLETYELVDGGRAMQQRTVPTEQRQIMLNTIATLTNSNAELMGAYANGEMAFEPYITQLRENANTMLATLSALGVERGNSR